jgi:hypothetical protein
MSDSKITEDADLDLTAIRFPARPPSLCHGGTSGNRSTGNDKAVLE